jgi:hypothetical protein
MVANSDVNRWGRGDKMQRRNQDVFAAAFKYKLSVCTSSIHQ